MRTGTSVPTRAVPSGFRVQGLGFRVWGLDFRVSSASGTTVGDSCSRPPRACLDLSLSVSACHPPPAFAPLKCGEAIRKCERDIDCTDASSALATAEATPPPLPSTSALDTSGDEAFPLVFFRAGFSDSPSHFAARECARVGRIIAPSALDVVAWTRVLWPDSAGPRAVPRTGEYRAGCALRDATWSTCTGSFTLAASRHARVEVAAGTVDARVRVLRGASLVPDLHGCVRVRREPARHRRMLRGLTEEACLHSTWSWLSAPD